MIWDHDPSYKCFTTNLSAKRLDKNVQKKSVRKLQCSREKSRNFGEQWLFGLFSEQSFKIFWISGIALGNGQDRRRRNALPLLFRVWKRLFVCATSWSGACGFSQHVYKDKACCGNCGSPFVRWTCTPTTVLIVVVYKHPTTADIPLYSNIQPTLLLST